MEITNMKDIAIYGAGGFGREVACLINKINKISPQWNLVGFFTDSESEWGTVNEYGKVLGGADVLNSWPTPIDITIAIGSPKAIEKIHNKLHNDNIDFPNIISPDLIMLDNNNFRFGIGNIICAKSFVSCNVEIGNFNIINNSVNLGHDAIIGDYNSIMPAVCISGGVHIGNKNFIGVNSVILQYNNIGNNTTIGAGSVVMRNTKDNNTYVGNPASKFKF